TRTGKPLTLGDGGSALKATRFTSDGRTFAAAGEDRAVRPWETATGKLLRRLALGKETEEVDWLQFTRDGRPLAPAQGSQQVHLGDVSSGKRRATIALPDQLDRWGRPVARWPIDLTPDGRFLVAANTGNRWIWDLVSRREIGLFDEDDGRWVLGASYQAVS